MQVEITNIKTGGVMFSCLNYLTKKEIKEFVSFYNSFRENGSKKYKVKARRQEK